MTVGICRTSSSRWVIRFINGPAFTDWTIPDPQVEGQKILYEKSTFFLEYFLKYVVFLQNNIWNGHPINKEKNRKKC